MTIARMINGKLVPITLTDSELYEAYAEQQFLFDRMDCEDMCVGLDDEELVECYGVTGEQFESLLDEMATEKRRNMDKYDMSWDFARDEAIRETIRRSGYVSEENA